MGDQFAVCLGAPSTTGVLSLGQPNPNFYTGAIAWTNLLQSSQMYDSYYSVTFSAMYVVQALAYMSTVCVCVCVLSHWVHAAIVEVPDLPSLKCSSHWSPGLFPASVGKISTIYQSRFLTHMHTNPTHSLL